MKLEPPYLAAFYKEITDEIRRLREEQWRPSYYFVVEGIGVIYLFTDGRTAKFVNVFTLFLAVLAQIGCFLIYLHHLHKNHSYIGRTTSAASIRKLLWATRVDHLIWRFVTSFRMERCSKQMVRV